MSEHEGLTHTLNAGGALTRADVSDKGCRIIHAKDISELNDYLRCGT